MTVGQLLLEAREALDGIDSALLDAELLLGHVLDRSRAWLLAHRDAAVDEAVEARYRSLVARRARREPVAYLVGRREFYGLDLIVDARVLIPRPDTETLVEVVLEALPSGFDGIGVDVGTGSGAVALAIAHERPLARVLATDLSAGALAVASANARQLGLSHRVRFARADALTGVVGPVAWIASNPPYISRAEAADLMPDVANYEPASALFAPERGLGLLSRLVSQASATLLPGGLLALECASWQAAEVAAMLGGRGWSPPAIHRDLAGRERVVSTRRAAAPGS